MNVHGKYKPVKWYYKNEYSVKNGKVVQADTLWPACDDDWPGVELQSRIQDGDSTNESKVAKWHRVTYVRFDLSVTDIK